MPAEIKLSVYLRVGQTPEAHFGDVTMPVRDGEVQVHVYRQHLAEFLRAAADAVENPTDDEGVDDAAPE
ncbi:hypothetical protein AB0H51_11395 [Streptomyces griseoluteus]|uniref:hypothetical protein n=1 Tax=Streptomyces griseoluteus TaxID=29306 RepID=UPI0033F73394